MLRFKVTGDDLRKHYPDETLLGQVFEDIEQELAADEKVVCRYILNGRELDEGDEVRLAETPLRLIETLEYLSEDRERLLTEVITGWLEALPELTEKIDGFAIDLRQGRARRIETGLTELVENCEFLVQSLWSIRGLLGDSAAAAIPSWRALEANTRRTLEEVISSLEKKDFVQLADLIEYDLNDALEHWRRLLLVFSEQAGVVTDASQSGSTSNRVDRKISSH